MRQRLLDHARHRILGWVKRCSVQPGRGCTKTGDGILLHDKPQVKTEVDEITLSTRLARELVVEIKEDRVFINFPPLLGVIATISGRSIFSDPRPSFLLQSTRQAYWARLSYGRTNASFQRKPGPEGESRNSVDVGVFIQSAAVAIIATAPGFSPQATSPDFDPDDPDIAAPYAGSYVRWYYLGQVIDSQAFPNAFALPQWGGMNELTIPEWGGDEIDPHWVFATHQVYP